LKLLTFRYEGKTLPGLLDGDKVVDLAAAGLPVGKDGDLALIVEAGESVLGRVREAQKSADAKRYKLSDVKEWFELDYTEMYAQVEQLRNDFNTYIKGSL